MFYIRQGATHKVVIGPAVAVGDGFTPVTNLTLSGADEAEVILHDNGTVVDISAYTFAAITTADGYYHLTLQSGISNTVGHMTVVINDDSLILPLRQDFTVLDTAPYDANFADAAAGPLQSTVAGRTLDVSAGGEAGIDWANIGSPTTAVDLSGTDIQLVDTTTTNTDMRGTDNAALASVLGALTDAAAAGDPTTADTAMQYIKQLINILVGTAGVTTFPAEAAPGNAVSLAEVLRAIHTDVTGLNGDAMRGTDSAATAAALTTHDNKLGTVSNLGGGATLGQNLVDVAGATFSTTTDSLEAVRNHVGDGTNLTEAGGTGNHLTAVPWNAAWDTEVQSECTDALNAYDPPTNAEMEARTLVAASYFDPAADTVANVTTVGSVSGAVGSVTGAVGSVTGAVGSVTGNVGGNVVGSVGSLVGHTVQTGDSFARIGVAGAGLTNINLPNQTMDIIGNITGNLSGSVGSVTGAVGSVTGAVGSVTGAVGSVAGNVDGNVTGSVGSVVGAVGSVTGSVGSVTGAVGSVTGNVGGNVVGSVGSLVGHTVQTGDSFARIGATGSGLTSLATDASVWAYVIDDSKTALQVVRGMASTLMGKASGMGTTSAVFRDLGDTKNRITATVDASGNRTAVTLDLT